MQRISAFLLSALLFIAAIGFGLNGPVGPSEAMAGTATVCHQISEPPPRGNPWMLLPGVGEHFWHLGCYFHRQPPERPHPWQIGTCTSCHTGATPYDRIPQPVHEMQVSCHYQVSPQQAAAPCNQPWCPWFVNTDEGTYIAGMLPLGSPHW